MKRSNCLVGAVGREGGEDSAARTRLTAGASRSAAATETVTCDCNREEGGEASQLTVELEDHSGSLLTASAKASSCRGVDEEGREEGGSVML